MLVSLTPQLECAGDGWCGGCCCSSGVSVVVRRPTAAHKTKDTQKHEQSLAASWTTRPGEEGKGQGEAQRGEEK